LTDYSLAARLLWAPIPTAAKKKAKASKTWKTLKPGQKLRLVGKRIYVAGQYHETGSLFEVTSVNSLGAVLTGKGECVIHWGREWQGIWEKVAKTRRTKK